MANESKETIAGIESSPACGGLLIQAVEKLRQNTRQLDEDALMKAELEVFIWLQNHLKLGNEIVVQDVYRMLRRRLYYRTIDNARRRMRTANAERVAAERQSRDRGSGSSADEKMDVWAALALLNAEDRQIIIETIMFPRQVGRVLDGVAEDLGLSRATLLRRRARAMERLKQLLS